MASIADLRFRYRVYFRSYDYRRVLWKQAPGLAKPLAESRVALVTSAAFHLPEQAPFDESIKGGDTSWRAIPHDADLGALRIAHRSDAFDVKGIDADKNLALPLDRLRELEREGVIGSIAPTHYSFMGSIPEPRGLIEESAPAVARALANEQVDVVLLTPV